MIKEKQITVKTYSREELSYFKWFTSSIKHKNFIKDMINFAHKSIYEPQKDRWTVRQHPDGRICSGIISYLNGKPCWAANNRLNTNYSALTHLKNGINNLLVQDGIKDIIVFNHDDLHDYKELQKMEKYLLIEEYRDVLLSDKFDFYYEIESICIKSWNLGRMFTIEFKENYKKYLPWAIGIDVNDDLPGDPIDMLDGNDCYLIFTGKTHITNYMKAGVQVKKVTSVYLRSDDMYYVEVSMDPGKYKKTQLFAFYTSIHNVFVFKNDMSRIKLIKENNTSYIVIPEDLIRYPIQ